MIDRRTEAADRFAELGATHSDPEAMFMYGTCLGRLGDTARALPTLTACVDGGFGVPLALAHPWLASLRGAALDGLVARAEASRREAEQAFRQAGGPALLGA
jgi:hypothetical protein